MKDTIRVRFAPSPTGHLHIGGLRTALFNWLFARKHGGKFLLRVEDTDRVRSKQMFTDSILESLQWCSITLDEPVVIQSERITEHKKVLQKLLDDGNAYRCVCSEQEVIERQREFLGGDYLYGKYDGKCRDIMIGADTEKSYVIRFALPTAVKFIEFTDLIRGSVTFDSDQLDDFIIARSDGSPIYNFVVVVDDAAMKISHVIRGEDHIANTPKQILLYQACGYSVPQFAHLPLILGPSGDRLSKRDAATSVLDYKNNGFLPDALLNYLARLGWSHGDQELFSLADLQELFSLKAVGKKGSIFDPQKLSWVNSMHMRDMKAQDIVAYSTQKSVANELPLLTDLWDSDTLYALIDLYKDRTSTVVELLQEVRLLHAAPQSYNKEDSEKWLDVAARDHLRDLLKIIEALPVFSVELLTRTVKDTAKQMGIKLGHLAQPLRIALVGKAASPGVFALMSLVGKQESCARIARFLSQKVE